MVRGSRSTHITPTPAARPITSSRCADAGFSLPPAPARLSRLPHGLHRGARTVPVAQAVDRRPCESRRYPEHWDEIVRHVASLKAGSVLPSAMLCKLAAYERQNQLDLALRATGEPASDELLAHTARGLGSHCLLGRLPMGPCRRNADSGLFIDDSGRSALRDLSAFTRPAGTGAAHPGSGSSTPADRIVT